MRRVVVTGMALASPLGCDIETAFSGLQKLENCVEYDKSLDEYKRLNTRLSAYVKGFEIPSTYNNGTCINYVSQNGGTCFARCRTPG